jgi:hypothetical protein
MGPGEANYFRYYKGLGVIAKLATSYWLIIVLRLAWHWFSVMGTAKFRGFVGKLG